MSYRSLFRNPLIFNWIIASFVLFLVATFIAMLFYPGGTITDSTTLGYSFFHNFFSDLGTTITYAKYPNTISAVLFTTALVIAGCGLTVFFIAFRQFFLESSIGKWLSGLGSCCGVIAGLCFIGVALTPADLYRDIHLDFVFWAFRTFPVAVLCYGIAIFHHRQYPQRYGFVFVAFGILLVLYLVLLEIGPDPRTTQGLMIQATGQKIIVYATIITVLIQAVGAKRVLRERSTS